MGSDSAGVWESGDQHDLHGVPPITLQAMTGTLACPGPPPPACHAAVMSLFSTIGTIKTHACILTCMMVWPLSTLSQVSM